MRYTFSNRIYDNIANWFHNNIVEPLSRHHDKRKKTYYECCVCGDLEAPYFYDECTYSSMQYDYGWRKLKNDPRWICHHCHSHGYAPQSAYEPTFEEWQEQIVKPKRQHIRELIKAKDPEYYNECYFYDDEESVERYMSQLGIDRDEE